MTDPLLTDALNRAAATPADDRAVGAVDDSPKFGRLLLVLVIAVLLMGLLTFVSEAAYS